MFQRAAELDESSAYYQLGLCYLKGRGVGKDLNKARDWARKSAEAGEAKGMHLLGYILLQHGGDKHDEAAAVDWLCKAADKNYACSMNLMGEVYAHGLGDETRDYVTAAGWYRKALAHGCSHAAKCLAELKTSAPQIDF